MVENIFFDSENNDVIIGSNDIDTIGGNGSDIFPRGHGNDLTDGGAGNNTADFSHIDFAIEALAERQRELEALCSKYYSLMRQKV